MKKEEGKIGYKAGDSLKNVKRPEIIEVECGSS